MINSPLLRILLTGLQPEWYFTHVLNITHEHRPFMEAIVQPLLSSNGFRSIDAWVRANVVGAFTVFDAFGFYSASLRPSFYHYSPANCAEQPHPSSLVPPFWHIQFTRRLRSMAL